MALTSTQLQALKTAINGNGAWSSFAQNSDGYVALAQALNQPASPTFTVWRTEVPTTTVLDAIDFSKFTPSAALDDATLSTQLIATQRQAQLLAIQTKQMNLQMMTQGRAALDASKPNIRGGLRDAVIQLPSGSSGAFVSAAGASGVNVLNACTRAATEAEKILVTASQGSDTTGTVTARVMGFEGSLSAGDVEAARNLP
ncbi:MAG: hypothetical protein RJA36_2693 [Pseudomonadota bacterium]|jgi:hypothetical protein